MSHNLAQRNMH